MPVTRRDALRATAAGVVGTLVVGSASAGHSGAQPSHVTIEYDETGLEAYRPVLDLRDTTRARLNGLYAWTATSPEYTYDWYVYWAWWQLQDGVTDWDSHNGDHEPIYCAVDPSTGRLQRVVYSGYHWLKASAPRSAVSFHDDSERPKLYVYGPWHHYRLTARGGVDVSLHDLSGVIDAWLDDDGFHGDLATSQPFDPEAMLERESWWQSPFGVTPALLTATETLGLFGGTQTDV